MRNLSSIFNKKDSEKMKKKISKIDNDIFIRGDFEKQKYAELDDVEVEKLLAYIMRN